MTKHFDFIEESWQFGSLPELKQLGQEGKSFSAGKVLFGTESESRQFDGIPVKLAMAPHLVSSHKRSPALNLIVSDEVKAHESN